MHYIYSVFCKFTLPPSEIKSAVTIQNVIYNKACKYIYNNYLVIQIRKLSYDHDYNHIDIIIKYKINIINL